MKKMKKMNKGFLFLVILLLYPGCKKRKLGEVGVSYFSEIHIKFFEGKGRGPVVLQHGLGVNGRFWYATKPNLVEELTQIGFDVYVPDLSGVGLSKKRIPKRFSDYQKDITQIWDFVKKHSGKENLIWIGHSMGGMIIYASEKPYFLKCFVAVSSPGTFGREMRLFKIWDYIYSSTSIFIPALEKISIIPVPKDMVPLAQKLQDIFKGLPYGKIEDFFWNVENVPDIREYVFDFLDNMPAGVLSDFITGNLNFVFNITSPTLIIAGQKDYLATPPSVKFAYNNIKSPKKFVLVSRGEGFKYDYGHGDILLGKRAAEEVFPIIKDFVERCESGTTIGEEREEEKEENREKKMVKEERGEKKKKENGERRAGIYYIDFNSKKGVLLLQEFGYPSTYWKDLEDELLYEEISYVKGEVFSKEDVKNLLDFYCKRAKEENFLIAWGFSGLYALNLDLCFDRAVLISVPSIFNPSYVSRKYLSDLGLVDFKSVEYVKIPFLSILSTGDIFVYWWQGIFPGNGRYILLSKANFSDDLGHDEMVYGKKARRYVIREVMDFIH